MFSFIDKGTFCDSLNKDVTLKVLKMSYQLWAVTALLGYTVYQLVLKKLGHLPPQVTLAVVITFVAIVIWGSILIGDTKAFLGKINPDDWKWILLGGLVILIADYSFTKTYTMIGAESSVITIIVSALPITVSLLLFLVERKAVTPAGWLGMLITLSGIVVVVRSES